MAINFPDNPNANDVFTDAGKSWIWDGTTWKIYSSTTSGIGLGDLSVNTSSVGTAALSYNSTTGVFTYTPPDLSGYLTQQYTLPTASTTVLGGVKVDGSTITINGSGVISGANTYSLPTATTTVLGGVKIDGSTITINNGVITASSSSTTTNLNLTDESGDTECFPVFCGAPTNNQTPHTNTSLKFNATSGQLQASSFKKIGGSSSEFLKADGSIDSTSYSTFSGSYTDLTNKPTLVSNLNDLGDVNTTGVANGKILKYDLSTTSWIIADDGGGAGSGGGNVAVGSIMIWSGAANAIPTGWQLCDGTNGSPDLRDKFVVGAGSTYAVDDTGGSKDAVVVEHKHTTSVDNHLLFDGSGSQNISYGGAGGYPAQTFTMDNAGVSGTDKNLPPYYSLCYIYCTAAGSNQTFIGLSDTPISHSNGKWLQSNGSSLVWADAPSGTTISGNAAERVITGSATANTLNASDKLTLASNGIMTLTGQLIVDQVNINDNIVQTNTATDELIVRGKGVGGSHHLKLDDHVNIVGDAKFDAGVKDKDGDLGSSGQILSSTGTQVNWIDAPTGFSGNYSDLYNKPTLFSGSYNDLSSKPTLVTSINGLSDVSTGTISTNDVLQWNGSAWAAAAIATSSDLVAQARQAIDTSTSTQYNPVGYVDKLTLTVSNVQSTSKILLFFRMALGHNGSGTTKGRVTGPSTLYGGDTEFETGTGGNTHGILWDTSNSTTREFKIQYADNGGVNSTISNCELVAIEIKLS